MRAAAVFNGKIARIVQVRTNKPVLGQPKTVAGIGLGEVARRGVGKMHVARMADIVQGGRAVPLRIGRGLPPHGAADGRQHRLKGAKHRGICRAVLPQLHIGVVALGRDFGHQTRKPFALRSQIRVDHELRMVGDEVGIDAALTEQGMLDDLPEEGNGGLDAADDIFPQGAVHDAQGLFPVVSVGDEQRARRIIVGRKFVARADVGIQPHAGAAGRNIARNEPGIGGEVVLRVFTVNAYLHGTVGGPQIFFAVTQLCAEGHGNLLFHQVNAVATLGNAVLHLQAGVHLNEVGRAVRHNQELHRSQGVIPHGLDQPTSVVLELFPQVAGNARPGRRGDFNELLVVALHGTVAFVKGEYVAVHVGNDLNLNVPHVGQKFFHKQPWVAKGSLGHGGSLEKGVFQLRFLMNGKNASAAAAAFGLEHDGQADFGNNLAGRFHIHSAVRAGHHGNAQLAGHLPGLHLVAQQVHGLGGSADKGNAGLFAALRKARVFRGKTPAGVDAYHAALFGLVDNAVNIQVGPGLRAQQDQLLRRGRRGGGLVHIGSGHGRHGIKPLPDGTADAPGRDTAVGDKNNLAFQKFLHFRKCLVGHAFSQPFPAKAPPWRLLRRGGTTPRAVFVGGPDNVLPGHPARVPPRAAAAKTTAGTDEKAPASAPAPETAAKKLFHARPRIQKHAA